MKVVHCKKEPYTHYIGRPSILGNPYSHRAAGTTFSWVITVDTIQEALDGFYANAKSSQEILDEINILPEDAVLGCWCKPGPCHGDVIVKIWKELHNEDVA